jgi:predicted signal transduction protein with EAL and GGDEF domain
VAGHQVVVWASIGIAHSVPGATSAEELLRNADIAMYEATKQGKGQYKVFTPGMDQAAWRRWCAGTTPPAGCSLRLTSSPWPRRPA